MKPRLPSPFERSLIYADLLLSPSPRPPSCAGCGRGKADCRCGADEATAPLRPPTGDGR